MAEVLRWLIEEFGCEVFLCGSLADLDMHQQLQQTLDSNVTSHIHDLSRKYSLGEASALLSRMDCCVGVDTGLPHVAASFGVPIVKICGQTDQPGREAEDTICSRKNPPIIPMQSLM